jgi:hypothetical protein
MGMLRDLVKTSLKVVAAPIYIPIKIAESLSQPPQYNHWYHDGGQGEPDAEPDQTPERDG